MLEDLGLWRRNVGPQRPLLPTFPVDLHFATVHCDHELRDLYNARVQSSQVLLGSS